MLLVCCWRWNCSSCDHVALLKLILDARHSRSFDSRCIQKFVEVDCKIRLFICLFIFLGLFCSIVKKYFANVSCFMHDSPVGFPIVLWLTVWWNDNLWAELGVAIWVPVLIVFVYLLTWVKNQWLYKTGFGGRFVFFQWFFLSILAAHTFSSSRPAVAHHLQNLFLDQVHQLVHPFVLKLLRGQEDAKLAALDKLYISCGM